MSTTAESLFVRFRKDGNPAYLGQVFDLTAPELLRLAIHLAGDAAEAEDLVQSTFLAAMQGAAYDASRRLLPWLAGILANQARLARRRRRRELDFDRLLPPDEPGPLDRVQEGELSGALTAALDELPEPYRQVLILRLRHGLKPADIAHVLQRSPGAVRVQLHRGLGLLRRALPAGFAATVLAAISPSRGLAAVRRALLAHARSHWTGGGISMLIGAVLSTKISVLASVLLVAALITAMALGPWRSRPDRNASTTRPSRTDGAARGSTGVALAGTRDVGRTPLASASADGGHAVFGRVVDAVTRDPIAAAEVRLFGPRRTSLLALKQRWAQRVDQDFSGEVTALAGWPLYPRPLSDLARAGTEEFPSYEPPPAGASPVLTAIADQLGQFEIALPDDGGAMVVTHSECEPRVVPLLHAQDEIEVAMWRPHVLGGHVVDERGSRMRQVIDLLFIGGAGRGGAHEPGDVPAEPVGAWLTRTDQDGSFRVQVAADDVTVVSRTPGLVVREQRPRAEAGAASMVLIGQRSPVLTVTDAATRRPIESFSLVTRDEQHGGLLRAGSFFAPGGKLDLFEDREMSTLRFRRTVASSRLSMTVWSQGHAARVLEVSDLGTRSSVDVALESGELPSVEGSVRASGMPVAGARVSLLAFEPLFWNPEDCQVIAAAIADDGGRFLLRAPPGEYTLHATGAGADWYDVVTVPLREPVRVELSDGTSVIAVVRDAAGASTAGATVFVLAEDGRQRWLSSDERGEARFLWLPPGRYTVGLAGNPERLSFPTIDSAAIELAPGERRRVELVHPVPASTRTVRLVIDGVDDYGSFEVRDGWRQGAAWCRVGRDGVLPIDLTASQPRLELQDGAGRRWYRRLATWPPRDGRIVIAMDGSGYEGVVVDATTSRPLAGVRVLVQQRSEGGELDAEQSTVTDGDGRFRMEGLRPGESLLMFNEQPDSVAVPDLGSRYQWVRFQPRARPAQPPASLAIRLPTRDDSASAGNRSGALCGQVRMRGSLEPVRAGRVTVTSVFPAADGDLLVATATSSGNLDRDGRFSVVGPIAPVYRVTLATDAAGTTHRFEVRARSTGDEESFDLLID